MYDIRIFASRFSILVIFELYLPVHRIKKYHALIRLYRCGKINIL